MFMSSVTKEGCADGWGLDSHLRPCWCVRPLLAAGAILIWVTCAVTRTIVMYGLPLRAMSGSVIYCTWSL